MQNEWQKDRHDTVYPGQGKYQQTRSDRYYYTYDNADRLIKAAFAQKQHTADAWSSSQLDFSVTGASGKITYDLNGNLLSMLQKGVIPGTAAPVTVDDLQYTYASYSNKLAKVTDNTTLAATVNGSFGDFKDGVNARVRVPTNPAQALLSIILSSPLPSHKPGIKQFYYFCHETSKLHLTKSSSIAIELFNGY